MPFPGGSVNASNSLRQPSLKRISTPNSIRLTTITEGPNASPLAPPIPRRSSRRDSASHSEEHSQRRAHRWSGSGTSTRTAPPPYEWVQEPPPARDDDEVIIDPELEKLRRERRGKGGEKARWKRGGYVRVVLVAVAVVVVLAIALGVGLGIGLKKKGGQSEQKTGGGASNTPYKPPQKFPLGEYSLDTALMSVSTACTSKPATWRCFPYFTYSPNGSTNNSSLAVYNWIITNTSSTYPTNTTGPTSAQGVPANLTVSTTNDPFGLMFKDKALTYVYNEGNDTSARYTFDFSMLRRVVPSPAITADGTNAECFFNSTVFTANIYLRAKRTIFPGGATTTTSPGGYEPWPYAVEIQQTAQGGADVPNCYRTVDGVIGQRITNGLAQKPAQDWCACEYRNY